MHTIMFTIFSVTLFVGGVLMIIASTGEDKPRLLLASKVLSAVSATWLFFLFIGMNK